MLPFKFRIHRSFVQLFVVLLLFVALQGRGVDGIAQFAAAVAVLFVAVILHESSHALAAKSLGVKVRDIVVHPLGGMTRLDWAARDPKKEALISLAGPAANMAIAAIVWACSGGALDHPGRWIAWFVVPFLTMNLALGALNLVPAFPMDGGRVLRALLSVKLGHVPATRVAARIGRWLALLTLLVPFVAPTFGWSFWQALAFPIVGLFVFVLGEVELKQAEAAELLERMGATLSRRGGPPPPRQPGVIDVEATSRVLPDDR